MTSIEQKLVDKLKTASLNFSMKDNKIQNEFGNDICKLETHQTIEDYDSVINLLKELKTNIPDLEERINNISTNNISITPKKETTRYSSSRLCIYTIIFDSKLWFYAYNSLSKKVVSVDGTT